MQSRRYGVFLSIRPSTTGKRVTIHCLPCGHFKQNPNRKGDSRFHKEYGAIYDAVDRASRWSLEWHARIKRCAHCVKAGRFPS